MPAKRIAKAFGLISLAALVAGCGMFQRDADAPPIETRPAQEILDQEIYGDEGPPSSTIWDFFRGSRDSEDVGAVNRYIWNASLETLSFLPLDSVDPFTGSSPPDTAPRRVAAARTGQRCTCRTPRSTPGR